MSLAATCSHHIAAIPDAAFRRLAIIVRRRRGPIWASGTRRSFVGIPGERQCEQWRSNPSAGSVPRLRSLDHLVGAHEDRWGHGQAQRLGGVEIDYQLESGRLLDWQIGGVGALEDLSGVTADLAMVELAAAT